MRTVETIRDKVLHSNDNYEPNDVLYIIDEIIELKDVQHNKEIERIIMTLEANEKEAKMKAKEHESVGSYLMADKWETRTNTYKNAIRLIKACMVEKY